MQDCCIVLNPNARAAREMQLVSQLSSGARGAAVRLTTEPGEAEYLAREAVRQGFRTVVAAGGDGTVNEVLSGIVGTSARLGVIPVGTVNVFARELGLPLDWEEALSRISRGRERVVDVGWANGQPFMQLAGVGFDAEVVSDVSSEAKRIFGPGAYVWSALQRLGAPPSVLRVQADGIPEMDAAWVLVGLGRFYGGPIPLFPLAKHDDGLLDVLVVRDFGLLTALQTMALVPFGWHTRLKGVEYFQTRSLHVDGEAALELDGEAKGRGAVDFRVSDRFLRVVN